MEKEYSEMRPNFRKFKSKLNELTSDDSEESEAETTASTGRFFSKFR